MEIILATGISYNELLDMIKRLTAETSNQAVLLMVSPDLIDIEVFDTETKVKKVGTEALAEIVRMHRENKLSQ